MIETLIKIENLTKIYDNVTPLKNVNIKINKGDIIAIIGPSGTGKSTLLRMINQLEKVTSGKIFFHDEDITNEHCKINLVRQKIGMIFQSFNLFAHLTVIENIIAAPIYLKGLDRQTAYDNAKNLLKSVGLINKMFNYPDELSGGQQQRIAIVRALAMEPEIILFDEPTSALDPTMVGEVESVIKKVAQSGTTMMIVTHGMDFAREISNRVFYMDEGGIYEDGTPKQLFDNPQRDKTRQFIKRLKVLEIFIDSTDFDFLSINTLIEEFAVKNDIAPKMKNSLLSLFEEICLQILLPELENPKIKVLIEYSKVDESIEFNIKYNGKKFDVNDSNNDIALNIIKGRAKKIDYKFTEGNELANNLTLKF